MGHVTGRLTGGRGGNGDEAQREGRRSDSRGFASRPIGSGGEADRTGLEG